MSTGYAKGLSNWFVRLSVIQSVSPMKKIEI